ncbi:phage tail protein [Enterobacter asburiae]|uniref:phage tail protein n=1 Tax=Enterobacter asburiae TaxID=61645 RepID=UPI001938685F|nr:phage tail protein [Enterobacter asburiae]QQE39166.1 phage tail protein [Enterobacter asburiae]
MTAKYFAILTNQGAARLANATALGTQLNLTQMAVGDANGTLPTPDPAQTKLVNQKRIAPLNLLAVDPNNTSQIIAEQIIPENEGGFWIREIGLYDEDGILIAVANCPETYKPQLQEGSGRTQTIRMILIVSSTSSISLKIDPSVVLATRQYVDDKVIEVKGYADDQMKKHIAADNPHKQYPLIANALKEIADAGLSAEVLKNLGLKEAAKRDVGTGANQIPDMASFSSSQSSPGFQKLPSGLILQWGIVSGGSSYTVTFPVSFPIRTLMLMAIPHTTSAAGVTSVGVANCSDLGTSQFYIVVGKVSQGAMIEYERACYWFAVGI